eukprot:gnl/TRDRNA2_/TRDRNA2_170043_c0_seq2.p1 gnl/TRDRNA2_/TRDRNA2_170043_c0~~gnl/TRDRNA2_/TRDRNA2_170043_c0_seq2.p1  ORF type:complete len:323 (+),score=63.14 gnl/TRDRNA2_/TRDRNA2_170043_c0_seq2:133-1101(+)
MRPLAWLGSFLPAFLRGLSSKPFSPVPPSGPLPSPRPPSSLSLEPPFEHEHQPLPSAFSPQAQPPSSPAAAPAAAPTAAPAAAPVAASPEEMRAARLRAFERQATSSTAAEAPASEPVPAPEIQPRSATEPANDQHAAPSSSGLPAKSLQRLMREMRQMEAEREKQLKEHGIELSLADPQGNDLRIWRLLLRTESIDCQSELGKSLRAHRVDIVEFEMWIPDGFPTLPPKLRVLSPVFNVGSFFVQQHGALCLEVLTNQGWSPAMSLSQLGVHVKTMMSSQAGTVSHAGRNASAGPEGRRAAWQVAQQIEAGHQDWQHFKMG